MFQLLSHSQLNEIKWSEIEYNKSTASDTLSLKVQHENEKEIRKNDFIAVGLVEFNETVECKNPDSHSVFINTFPRFKDFENEKQLVQAKVQQKCQTKLSATQFYDLFVKRTQRQCDEERTAKQGSEEWLQVRKLSLTASNFGTAAGNNPYQSPQELLEEKLNGSFNGNALTVWGNEHEPHARETFVEWFRDFLKARYVFEGRNDTPIFELKEDNAIKFAAEPWLAVSPDGILFYEDWDGTEKVSLVEFKCPTRDNANPLLSPYVKYENGVPPYYFDQVQGISGYLNENKYCNLQFEDIWFVVWRPTRSWITHLQVDPVYYKTLKSKLFLWYFKLYLPALTRKYNQEDQDEIIKLE
jgi:putative phage-type endonuclease